MKNPLLIAAFILAIVAIVVSVIRHDHFFDIFTITPSDNSIIERNQP